MKVIISGGDKGIVSELESVSEKDLSFQPYSTFRYSGNERFWKSNVHKIKYSGTHIARHAINVIEDISLKTIDAPNVVSLLFVEKGLIQCKTENGGL